MRGRSSSASCKDIFQSRGVRVAFLIHLYMAFITARAKYAFGYGRRLGSYVRAALVRARNPSDSSSGTNTPRCQLGLVCTKNLASIVAKPMYSTTSFCRFFESFDLTCMLV